LPALKELEKKFIKENKIGKKRWFDYLNQLVIMCLIVFLIHYVYGIYNKNKIENKNSTQKISLINFNASQNNISNNQKTQIYSHKITDKIPAPTIST
jgi:hypothetical protein